MRVIALAVVGLVVACDGSAARDGGTAFDAGADGGCVPADCDDGQVCWLGRCVLGSGGAEGEGEGEGDGEGEGGEGEGEGEGEPERDCTGTPVMPEWSGEELDYAQCCYGDWFYGDDCPEDRCADSPEAAEFLTNFREVLADRGYADRVEIRAARYVEDRQKAYYVDFVFHVEWWRCPATLSYFSEAPPWDLRPVIEERLPEFVGGDIPSWPEVLEMMMACEPEAQPQLCLPYACLPLEVPAGECGSWAIWWTEEEPGYYAQCAPQSGSDCEPAP